MNSVEQINAFVAHIKRLTPKFTESRSSLRNLLVYLRIPGPKKRFIDEQDVKRKCASPNDRRLVKYAPAIKELSRVWGTDLDYGQKAPLVAPPAVVVASQPMTLVEEVKSRLIECKEYACNDVGTFPQCVNQSLSNVDITRIKTPNVCPVGAPILSPDRSWKTRALQVACEAVTSKKAGECTNYAYYAAHILSKGLTTPKPRIEIVSWEGKGRAKHLFVIVGRKGGSSADGMIPPIDTWNDDLVIVDCWALTLGWECVYTKNDYCFKGMMYPLKVQMDSTIKSTGLPMNVQGGLRKTSFDLTK